MNIKKTSKEISKELNKIENALKRKLDSFYNSNIKGSQFAIETLQQKYANTIKNLIRQTVQDSYLYGSSIVTRQISDINSDFVPFISVTDVQHIQQVADKVSNQFWKTAGRLHRRETTFTFQPFGDLELKPQFDTAAAIIGLSAYATFSAFNNAVISKIQIVNNPVALGIGTNIQEGALSLEFDDLQDIDLTNLQGRVMFLTQEDAAVDPEICEPLNRTVYDADDFDIPEPPLHNHCRCRLVPLVDNSENVNLV